MTRDPVVVVGSGASGAHFAAELVGGGRRVVMVDVGRTGPDPVFPDADFTELRSRLEDPWSWFLGDDHESLILPRDTDEEYYGFPPSKNHVFRGIEGHDVRARGFSPLLSYARGGLAQAWTGGSYPFDDRELEAFPFDHAGIAPYYETVARRIGVSGVEDDMAAHFPMHGSLLAPPDLDAHATRLLDVYARKRARLNAVEHCRLGRARLAVLSEDRGERRACDHLGRCLWGCPRGALYTPSHTIAELLSDDRFTYLSDRLALRFKTDASGRVTHLAVRRPEGGGAEEIEVGTLVLAAGTLPSARIFLESLAEDGADAVELRGLMDNRQLLMPFVNLGMLGRQWEPASYQYHLLAFGLDLGGAADYVHGLVTTLKTALIHPVAPNLPFSMRAATRVFRDVHGALGLVNVNFADDRRDENVVRLEGSGRDRRLAVEYVPHAGEDARVRDAARRFRRILRKLGCIAPAGMTHLRPMGASVHYAGTFPMGGDSPHDTDAVGRSRMFDNLFFADGSTFPWLPAKNLTFTLMANATRIAREAFLG